MATAASSSTPKILNIISWILKIILAAAFCAAASFKLAGGPEAVAEFDHVGLGQWFRYFTGLCEISGAAMLLWPRTTLYGSLLMSCVVVGAFFAQLLVLHGDLIHVFAIFGMIWLAFWLGRRARQAA